jgi:hypothetical protein
MWRSGTRLGFGAGVVALVGSAVFQSPSPVQTNTNSLQVSSLTVQAGQTTPFIVTFNGPAFPSTATSADVALTMPAGWVPVTASEEIQGCSQCGLKGSSSTSNTFTTQVSVPPGVETMFSLALQVTPSAFASAGSFTAVERYAATSPFVVAQPVTLATVTSPLVTVNCPADGLGNLTVYPTSVPAATNRNFTFSYKAGSCGAGENGVVTVTVPPEWTPPTRGPGPSGLVTSTSTPLLQVSGSTITVPAGNLKPGVVITFEYQMAQAPASSVPYVFAAAQGPADLSRQPLASLPTVLVTPVQTSSSPTPPVSSPTPPVSASTPPVSASTPVRVDGAGIMTVTPTQVTAARPSTLRFTYTAGRAGLARSGEVTVQVPPGWTAPSQRRGQGGYTSVSAGRLTLAGRRIMATGARLGDGQQLIITYTAGTAPRSGRTARPPLSV